MHERVAGGVDKPPLDLPPLLREGVPVDPAQGPKLETLSLVDPVAQLRIGLSWISRSGHRPVIFGTELLLQLAPAPPAGGHPHCQGQADKHHHSYNHDYHDLCGRHFVPPPRGEQVVAEVAMSDTQVHAPLCTASGAVYQPYQRRPLGCTRNPITQTTASAMAIHQRRWTVKPTPKSTRANNATTMTANMTASCSENNHPARRATPSRCAGAGRLSSSIRRFKAATV